jgi:hypothetical protein
MQRVTLAVCVWLCATAVAWADDLAIFEFGDDAFGAGRALTHDSVGADDLFLAGDVVRGRVGITGSAHLAGRKVSMDGAVGGDAYIAGEDVTLADVAGDATVLGRAVTVAAVGQDLRIAGSEVVLGGPVGGSAIVAGESVQVDGVLSGDVMLTTSQVEFGPEARIGGTLFLYEEEIGTLEIPERVVPEARIQRQGIEGWEGPKPWDWRRVIASFLMGVIVVAGLAALIAAVIPERLAEMRRSILDRPFHTLGIGFVTQSAIVGSAILFAMTLIGIFLTPASILLALLAGFAGYVVAAYSFGVGLTLAFGRLEPDSIGERALAAGIGALVAGLIGLIPLVGWLFVLVLVLAGVGAISGKLFLHADR